MRKESQEESEMVSQLLFGESYEILNEADGYFEIQSAFDKYSGWISRIMHHDIPESYYRVLSKEKQPVQEALLMNIEGMGQPPRLTLPGSTLPGYNPKKNNFEINGEVFHIRWTFEKFNINGFSSINKTASHFLNAPYLWGGRSVFGCDCSGFVQILFKIHGIALLRDADQQAEQGKEIALEDARLGDLAFFADENGFVYHVGMVLSPEEIIHGSGYVHIDRLDQKGIFNLVRQEYSHTLYKIKRMTE